MSYSPLRALNISVTVRSMRSHDIRVAADIFYHPYLHNVHVASTLRKLEYFANYLVYPQRAIFFTLFLCHRPYLVQYLPALVNLFIQHFSHSFCQCSIVLVCCQSARLDCTVRNVGFFSKLLFAKKQGNQRAGMCEQQISLPVYSLLIRL